MARPKAGTEAGDRATKRWHETMLKRYGGTKGVRKKMQETGRIGGSRTGILKGFALDHERARSAGRKGGMISRRGPGNSVETKIKPRIKEIEDLYFTGYSLPQIAEKLELPYSSLLRWAREELAGYGATDDIEKYEKILEYKSGRNKDAS